MSELPGENHVSPYSSKSSSIFSVFTIRVIFVILGRKMTENNETWEIDLSGSVKSVPLKA